MKNLILLGILLLSTLTLADDTEWKPIEGVYALTGEDLVDPNPNESNDSYLRVNLVGQNAKALYQAMQTLPVTDECTGSLAKNIGEMQCLYYQPDNKYECHFSIEIATQKVKYGLPC